MNTNTNNEKPFVVILGNPTNAFDTRIEAEQFIANHLSGRNYKQAYICEKIAHVAPDETPLIVTNLDKPAKEAAQEKVDAIDPLPQAGTSPIAAATSASNGDGISPIAQVEQPKPNGAYDPYPSAYVGSF